MSRAHPAGADVFFNWPYAIQTVFRETSAPSERAARLASLLHDWMPGRDLYGCQLFDGTAPHLSVVGREGEFHSEWTASLLVELARLPAMRVGEVRTLSGLSVAAARICTQDLSWGYLLLGGEADLLQLIAAADQLAVQLRLEAEQRRGQALREDLEEDEELATLGVATRELLHDVANRLNQIMLQVSILLMRAPEETSADLKVIRDEGMKAAQRLGPLQRRGRRRRTEKRSVDLNRVLHDLAEDGPLSGAGVRFTPAPGLSPLLVRPGALKRLLRLLLRGLLTETGAGALREARTEPLPNGRLGLILTGDGAIPANALDQPFDSEDGLFAEVDPIDRLAMQVLLRETGGALQARNRPEGGVDVRIEWS